MNIAPLNFCMVDEKALLVDAVITDRHGNSLHGQGEETTDFDLDDWHALLGQNRGDSLSVIVSAKFDDGWHTYSPFSIYVSANSPLTAYNTKTDQTLGLCVYPYWHHEADLWLLDLSTGEKRPMAGANSKDTESFHNWSTNSRWLVLSSRRDDGLYTRPYFCHVDSKGNVSKAFYNPI